MKKNGYLAQSSDCALLDSLIAIRQAQLNLHRLTGMCTTASVLTSQIELCELLLVQISGIHDSLAEDLKQSRIPGQRVVQQFGLNA
jgi:hypothetical protein